MTVRACLCHCAPCLERLDEDTVSCPITRRPLRRWRVLPLAMLRSIPSQKIADNPRRKKVCRACRVLLPVTDFGDNGRGYPRARCNDCRRGPERERYRHRYHTNEDFRLAEVARKAKRVA